MWEVRTHRSAILCSRPMASAPAANLDVFDSADVVEHYAGLQFLTACEQRMFETYLRPGGAILDLGVGGGRTTPFLSAIASQYIGADYSEKMVCACRKKFPNLQFEVADAADLSRFADRSFDAVVFSFNGSDYIAPEENRHRFLQECHRVLKPGGTFVFSSHNPRSIFVDLVWDRERVRRMAHRAAGNTGLLLYPVLALLTGARVGLACLHWLGTSVPRIARRLTTKMFWRGKGYWMDPTHGGLLTYCAAPDRVTEELATFGFKLLQYLPEDFPTKARPYVTRWFYYAFAKQ